MANKALQDMAAAAQTPFSLFTSRFSFSNHSGLSPVPSTQQHTPTPGPLHLTFPLSECSSSDIHKTCILTSFRSLLKHHVIREGFPYLLIQTSKPFLPLTYFSPYHQCMLVDCFVSHHRRSMI